MIKKVLKVPPVVFLLADFFAENFRKLIFHFFLFNEFQWSLSDIGADCVSKIMKIFTKKLQSVFVCFMSNLTVVSAKISKKPLKISVFTASSSVLNFTRFEFPNRCPIFPVTNSRYTDTVFIFILQSDCFLLRKFRKDFPDKFAPM